jgi:hypothetical protein
MALNSSGEIRERNILGTFLMLKQFLQMFGNRVICQPPVVGALMSLVPVVSKFDYIFLFASPFYPQYP